MRAGNDHGWGGWRNSAAAGPYTPPPPPATPSSVSVTRSDGALTASWDAPANAAAYHVTYSSTGGSSWLLASLDHASTTIEIGGVDNAKTYVVGVRARNSASAWSGWRNSPAAGPFVPPTPTPVPAPERPTGLTATAGNGSVTLAWDAVSGATGYEYSVRYAGVAWSDWTAIAGNAATATVDGLANGTEHRFKLRAVNASGESKPAPAAAPWYVAATPAVPPPPPAPTGLSVDPGEDSLEITWDAVSEATGYDVRAKAEGASDWHDVASNVTGTSYTYTTSETMDYVGVRARNANGASAWTDVSRMPADDLLNVATGLPSGGGASAQSGVSAQSVQAQSQLAAPTWGTIDIGWAVLGRTNLVAEFDLNWTGSSGATGYNLACSDTERGGWDWYICGWVDASNSNTVTYTSVPNAQSQPVTVSHYRRTSANFHPPGDYHLVYGRPMVLAIRAVNADPAQASAWVNTPVIRPVRAKLDDFTSTRTDGRVTLSWTPNPSTTGYEVYCDTYTAGEAADYTLCATLSNVDSTASSHRVTITSWTAGGTDYSIDNTSVLDIVIDSTNAWDKGRFEAPFINPSSASTLSSTSSGDEDITRAKRQAVAFTTGSNSGGYVLASVTVPLKSTGVSTTGQEKGLELKLYEMSGSTYSATSAPSTTALATLSGTAPTGTTSTYANTTFTCSGSGCDLDPDETYFLVATLHGSGTNYWSYAATKTQTLSPSNNGWDIEYGHYKEDQPTPREWASYSDYKLVEIVFASNPQPHPPPTSRGTGATLTIANHDGDWYYMADAVPDNTCKGPVSGSSKTLSGLTAGTSYTYTAYSDSHVHDGQRDRGGGSVHAALADCEPPSRRRARRSRVAGAPSTWYVQRTAADDRGRARRKTTTTPRHRHPHGGHDLHLQCLQRERPARARTCWPARRSPRSRRCPTSAARGAETRTSTPPSLRRRSPSPPAATLAGYVLDGALPCR